MNAIELQLSLLHMNWTFGDLFRLMFSWPVDVPNFYIQRFVYEHNLFVYLDKHYDIPWSTTQEYILAWSIVISLPIYFSAIGVVISIIGKSAEIDW